MSEEQIKAIARNEEIQRQTTLINDIVSYIKHFFEVYGTDKKRKDELSTHVIKLINLDPELYTAQNVGGQNLGMICADFGLEKVVLHVLDNYNASIQQDCNGLNLGMYAARNKMEIAVLKALDNKTASVQVNSDGRNIGLMSARRAMRRAVIKSLQNKKSSVQQDNHGFNLGMLCADYGWAKETWLALDNEKASIQQNEEGYNIGMLSARHSSEEVKKEMERCVCKALDNKIASKQQSDMAERTIGIYAIVNNLPLAAERAISNPEARVLIDAAGKSMEDYYHANKNLVKLLLDKYDRELVQGR